VPRRRPGWPGSLGRAPGRRVGAATRRRGPKNTEPQPQLLLPVKHGVHHLAAAVWARATCSRSCHGSALPGSESGTAQFVQTAKCRDNAPNKKNWRVKRSFRKWTRSPNMLRLCPPQASCDLSSGRVSDGSYAGADRTSEIRFGSQHRPAARPRCSRPAARCSSCRCPQLRWLQFSQC
jgi:hypothetical protein